MIRIIIKLLLPLSLLISGCAFYKPMPLNPDEEWARLEGINLNDLAVEPVEGEKAGTQSHRPFNYSDGLSIDEAAGLAVVLNPDLRAFRLAQGIARGQLVGAGLLPNPEIEASWLTGSGAWASEIDVAFNLTEVLLTRGLEKEAARIHIKEVRWEIANHEWKLVSKVRLQFTNLVYWDEALGLNRTQKKMADRTLASIKKRKTLKAATELDVIQAEAEVTEIERQGKRLSGERKRSLQGLNKLLGLPPAHDTQIQKPEKPLAYTPLSGEIKVLAEKLRVQRPDLLAAEQAYHVAEKELQIEYRKQFPSIHIGPSMESDNGASSFGLGFSIEIPIFNRNQGGIATMLAERDQKRHLYIAALHEARAELYAAWTEWETHNAELKFYFSKVAPPLERGLKLTEQAFKAGEIDLLQVLVFQDRVLASKREILKTLLDFHRARIEVKEAMGPAKPDRKEQESDLPDHAKDRE